jgi:parallel beta-helix repeat protein
MAVARRLRSLAVILAVVSVGLAVGTSSLLGSSQGGKTVTVGVSGCDYTTIQAAIDAVPDGSTIEVTAGTYKENLIVRNRDGLVLQGADPDTVTLDGNGPEQIDVTPGILILSSRNITVTGFRITNSQRGLEADDSTLLFIEANTIERNFRSGVYLLRSQGEIRDNVVRGNQCLSDKPAGGSGIAVYGSRVTLIGNNVTGNADAGLSAATYGDARSQVTGSGNTIRDNKGGDLVGNVSPTLLAEPPAEGTLDQVTVPLEAATIQEAVNRVKAGGTITVSAGTYKEQVQVYKSLTIRGAGVDQTALQAPGPDWLTLNVATDGLTVVLEGFTVTGGYGGMLIAAGPASAITLQDLKVKGDPTGRYTLLRIWEEPTVTLDRVSVLESQYYGLDVSGQAKLTVQKSTVSDSILGGVVISGSAVVTMRDTTIARNESYGVNVSNTAVAELTDCTVGANTKVGIRVYGSAQVTLTNSRVTGTKPDSAGEYGYGVYVYGEGHVALLNCTLSDNVSRGIWLRESCEVTLSDTRVMRTQANPNGEAGFGLDVEDGSFATLSRCTVNSNSSCGMIVDDDAHAVIDGCTFSENAYDGIYIHDAARAEITNSKILNTKKSLPPSTCCGSGIVGADSSQLTIQGNTISGNAEAGVWIANSAEVTVTGNTISDNKLGAVAVYGSARATIEDNTMAGNLAVGVGARGTSEVTITNNRITGTMKGQTPYEGWGIAIGEQCRATISGNTISDSASDGICLGASPIKNETVTAEISSNTIQKNKGYGVFADSDSGIKITGKGNTISGNTKGQLGGTTSKFPKGFGGGK